MEQRLVLQHAYFKSFARKFVRHIAKTPATRLLQSAMESFFDPIQEAFEAWWRFCVIQLQLDLDYSGFIFVLVEIRLLILASRASTPPNRVAEG